MRKGNFRLDLLYRLNVFTLELPPLRQRREDIPLLADFFIRKHDRLLSLDVRALTPAAMDRLCAYDWPGNVRDLENAIQSAMILCTDGVIDVPQLPARIRGYEDADVPLPAIGNLRTSSAQTEREVIEKALQQHGGNRTLTAEALGISRKTLFNKMKKYGI